MPSIEGDLFISSEFTVFSASYYGILSFRDRIPLIKSSISAIASLLVYIDMPWAIALARARGRGQSKAKQFSRNEDNFEQIGSLWHTCKSTLQNIHTSTQAAKLNHLKSREDI